MSAAAPTITKVVAQHLQELGFLWRQRAAASRSPDWRLTDLKRLDRRIEAHLDGLLVAARSDLAAVATHLLGEDPWAVTAAGTALLQLHTPKPRSRSSKPCYRPNPKRSMPSARALLHGPIDLIEQPLRAAGDSAPPHVAAAAIEALLYHGCKNVATRRLPEFVRHEDPAVRCPLGGSSPCHRSFLPERTIMGEFGRCGRDLRRCAWCRRSEIRQQV